MKIEITSLIFERGAVIMVAKIPEPYPALVSNIRPGDSEEKKAKKLEMRSKLSAEFNVKQREINHLHLGIAELTQKDVE